MLVFFRLNMRIINNPSGNGTVLSKSVHRSMAQRGSQIIKDDTCGSPGGRVLLMRDRSPQPKSVEFQRLLDGLGVTCSMSRSGNCWDNAVMESFFSTMKTERCNRNRYATRQAARADIFDYIERFYNPTRRHSTLGNKSPVNFERAAVA